MASRVAPQTSTIIQPAQSTVMSASAGILRRPSSWWAIRKLGEDDHERVHEEDDADRALGHSGLVLGEDRQQLDLGVAAETKRMFRPTIPRRSRSRSTSR